MEMTSGHIRKLSKTAFFASFDVKTSKSTISENREGANGMAEVDLYRREDWTEFRQLSTLTRKAGVPLERIPRLIVKELVDNALDHDEDCTFGILDDPEGFYVANKGDGIPGVPQVIAEIYSIGRPLVSSKMIRMPTRGALGNGLRVVAGAVLATGGSLIVRTNGRTLYLRPQDDGSTRVERVEPWDGQGTRVEIYLGSPLEYAHDDSKIFLWARQARGLAGKGDKYSGKTSPYWYDGDDFWSLIQAAGSRTVREQVAKFEGCGSEKAGIIAESYLGRSCDSLRRDEAEQLLRRARDHCKSVKPQRLGTVGPLPLYRGYSVRFDEFKVEGGRTAIHAQIPCVVEAWASVHKEGPRIALCVNRTPITGKVSLITDFPENLSFGLHSDYRRT
jgi:hypothetical protein